MEQLGFFAVTVALGCAGGWIGRKLRLPAGALVGASDHATTKALYAQDPDGTALNYPGQLKNKLLWSYRVYPYIGFQSVGVVVSIDPTFGLNERGSVSNGSCMAACVKVGLTDVSNACCSCAGATRTFKRSVWSSVTYLCQ